MTTYQIYNKAAEECLEYDPDAKEHQPWITQPCADRAKQLLEFQEQQNGYYKIRAPDTDKYLTVTYKNDWDGFGANGNDDIRARKEDPGNPLRNQMEIIGTYANAGNFGKKALQNGPFKIKGAWQLPQYFSNRVVEVSDTSEYKNEILQNWTNTDTPGDKYNKQIFIDRGLLDTCKAKGVSFNDCSQTSIKSCSLSANNTFNDCPESFCRTAEGIKTKECQNYARNNPNFDETVNKHCKDNPDDPFCDCYGSITTTVAKDLLKKGIVLKKICNEPKCVESNTAYRTMAMKTQTCSPIQVCIQGISLEQTTGENRISNVQFSCVQESNNTEIPKEPITVPTIIPKKGTDTEPFPIRTALISGIVILILLMTIILI